MDKPWYNKPSKLPVDAHIAIIGGGISGITLMLQLESAGYKTTLFEKNTDILNGASGNPAAIIDPFISLGDSSEKSFYLAAYQYALQFYKKIGNDIFKPCKLIKIARKKADKTRFEEISKTYDPGLLKFKNNQLVFPKSGYVIPANIRAYINQSENILSGANITKIEQESHGKWRLFNKRNDFVADADCVILSNAAAIKTFKQSQHLQLENIAGQITMVSAQYRENEILCSDGYITPPVKTKYGIANICGATFEKNSSLEITGKADKDNLEKTPFNFENPEIMGARRGLRATTKDHLPVSGPAPVYQQYLSDYAELHHGSVHKKFPEPPYYPNLYINVGLGARGFLSAPILAKYLTSLISGGKSPFNEQICHALHPARFIVRKLSKK